MATLYLQVGPPGAGKSFAAKQSTATVACPDRIREERCGGRHDVWGDPTQFAAWRRWSFEQATAQAATALQAGQDVVFDITACLRRERESVLAELGQYAEFRVAHVFRTPLEVCLLRNADRGDQKVPESVVEEKYHSLWSNPPTADEGFDQVVLAPVGWDWRARLSGGQAAPPFAKGGGRVEVFFEPGRLTVVLFPQAWTLAEAVYSAVLLKEEMNSRLAGWEVKKATILSSGEGAALAMQWLGLRQNKEELGPLEEEWAQFKTLFPPE